MLVGISYRHLIFHLTITAEIHARSLVNFHCQYAESRMNLARQRARAGNSTSFIVKKKTN